MKVSAESKAGNIKNRETVHSAVFKEISMGKTNNSTRNLIIGIVCIIFGIVLLIFKKEVIDAINTFVKWSVAAAIVVLGVINLIAFIKDRKKTAALIVAIVAFAAAIILLVFSGIITVTICITIGALLVLDGIFKIKNALAISKAKAKGWLPMFLFGILNIAIGAVAILVPFRFADSITTVLAIGLGIALIVFGVQQLVIGIATAKS